MSELQQGLLITAIGMGIVFAVITFLWGVMALMMRVTSRSTTMKDNESTDDEVVESPVPQMQIAEGQRRAAAAGIAVALAIVENQSRHHQPDDQANSGGLSPWQSAHRIRQLQNNQTRG